MLKYRILADDKATPALHDARQFGIVSGALPASWVVTAKPDCFFELSPEAWTKVGFWEEYFNGGRDALAIFEEEKRKLNLLIYNVLKLTKS